MNYVNSKAVPPKTVVNAIPNSVNISEKISFANMGKGVPMHMLKK